MAQPDLIAREKIKELYKTHSDPEIAAIIGKTAKRIFAMRKAMKLNRTKDEYLAIWRRVRVYEKQTNEFIILRTEKASVTRKKSWDKEKLRKAYGLRPIMKLTNRRITKNILNEAQVIEIIRSKGLIPSTQLAKRYGVSRGAIGAIWTKRNWKHLTIKTLHEKPINF